jgi:hypothetical protein
LDQLPFMAVLTVSMASSMPVLTVSHTLDIPSTISSITPSPVGVVVTAPSDTVEVVDRLSEVVPLRLAPLLFIALHPANAPLIITVAAARAASRVLRVKITTPFPIGKLGTFHPLLWPDPAALFLPEYDKTRFYVFFKKLTVF